MNTCGRPVLFYLFSKEDDIVIEEMADADASNPSRNGRRWVDVGMKTRKEAEAKRLAYLSKSKNDP
jgi:hypothetical protein